MKTKCAALILLCLMVFSAIPAFAAYYDHNQCVRILEEKGLAGPDKVCLPGTFTNSPAIYRYCAQNVIYAPVQGVQCVNKQTGEQALIRAEHFSADLMACQLKGPDWMAGPCYSCCGEAF